MLCATHGARREPQTGTFNGSREISFTIVSMTLSLVAGPHPVHFMGGIIGRLLNEFAMTIAVGCPHIRAGDSLSLTPMLVQHQAQACGEEGTAGSTVVSRDFSTPCATPTERACGRSLHHRFSTLMVSLAYRAVSQSISYAVNAQGLPAQRRHGRIMSHTEACRGDILDAMVARQDKDRPESCGSTRTLTWSCRVWGGGVTLSNTAGHDPSEAREDARSMDADEIIQDLRPRLATVPGIQATCRIPHPSASGATSPEPVPVRPPVPGDKRPVRQCPSTEARLKELPGFQDVTSDLQLRNPQVSVIIDRDKASSLAGAWLRIQESPREAPIHRGQVRRSTRPTTDLTR